MVSCAFPCCSAIIVFLSFSLCPFVPLWLLYSCALALLQCPRGDSAVPLGAVPLVSPNGDWYIERQISTMAHELAESATDPYVLSQRGWYMPAFGFEICDDCIKVVSAHPPHSSLPPSHPRAVNQEGRLSFSFGI